MDNEDERIAVVVVVTGTDCGGLGSFWY